MNNKKIKQINLILLKRSPKLADAIQSDADISTIDISIRLEIVNQLTEELVKFGLETNSEPNAYGKELEELIDILSTLSVTGK